VFDEETETARAEAMHRRALEVDKALGAKERMAGSYVNLGLVYQVRGDLAQAEGLYRKALELYKIVGDKKGTASSYANLAVLYG
jgi:protein O-GlcNAc transferase